MSTQQIPLTHEGLLEMFRETRELFRETREQMRETDRKFQETDRKFQETDRKIQEAAEQIKKTSHEVGKLSSSVGRLVESMVAGNIVKKFQVLGHNIIHCHPNSRFDRPELDIHGEIDLLLENGDVAILIEVKTTLKRDDVDDHIERIKKYRRCADASGGDRRRYLGAVAGASVSEDTAIFAHRKGMYVIVQSGDAVEIVPPPQGFTAKEW